MGLNSPMVPLATEVKPKASAKKSEASFNFFKEFGSNRSKGDKGSGKSSQFILKRTKTNHIPKEAFDMSNEDLESVKISGMTSMENERAEIKKDP